ncbi:MAG TPA: zinc-dependent peptidase [Candidatus Competibacteraceae bacterium]|nr:zinc-dependent peptidase [Candidatus Competibacteraceae bacterium]MCP5132313.1 zinc-dependent peptidase [Gammaproteobacteria bacterium]HRX71889.1 zinc-dependent peptidase [Candidatus Competibacteraceae bacterium]
MLSVLRNWRRRRWLQHARLSEVEWQATVNRLPVLKRLNAIERERLRDLATLFLHEKALDLAGGLEETPEMGLLIAAQACLPVLNLGLDYYQGWSSLILYPEGFLTHHEYTDSSGLVHRFHRPLIGEAWERGPVILSWADIIDSLDRPGLNVVIHEMAHKLDMLTGPVNGLPPLHQGMPVRNWSRDFNEAYQRLCQDVDRGQPTALDPYAAENPGEFFAVLSETFFETPERVSGTYPQVYEQLKAFYRQDPLNRPPICTISS